MLKDLNKKAQSILEYVIVFAVIVAAIVVAAKAFIEPAVKGPGGFMETTAKMIKLEAVNFPSE